MIRKTFQAHLSLWLVAGCRINQRFLLYLIECFLEIFFTQQIILFFTMHNQIDRVLPTSQRRSVADRQN